MEKVTSTKSALLLAIAAAVGVVAFFVLLTLSYLVALPAWLFALVALGVPIVSLLLAVGSLILAATSLLRGGATSARLAIVGVALLETLWIALLVSSNLNDLVCNRPCLIPLRPPGL